MSNAKQLGTKIVENMNALLCTLVAFVTFFLLGCPAIVAKSAWLSTFIDSFGLFNFAKFASLGGFKAPGALSAAGVFNVFVLIFAAILFAIGVFTLLKKAEIFDWKIDEKIGNFDTIIKLVFSAFTFFALLSFVCVAIFAGANKINSGVGGGTVAIFLFAIVACAIIWLVPIIQGAKNKKSEKTSKEETEKKSKDGEEVLYVEAGEVTANSTQEKVVLDAEVVKEPAKAKTATTKSAVTATKPQAKSTATKPQAKTATAKPATTAKATTAKSTSAKSQTEKK